ncbi:dTDP-4-dehydrorhamnose 3,5-epimerase [Helicobacter cholecystus]|uniref:dTDP-4-dehydrorhamnose 3,5-epimerase n=1 Tax=Helicobacter cholecystus TaxID=45498 RepID=A0A3D8ITL7_9HELI|nr:dTDP-4-dehydrorhamnose 3,5-epimerase [Helicobacter cholecystus]RDU68647.1 dTDP-4-dehydrorhamnose 3,5-epimerase [Helicobacter cholecystus]VEJ24440.1 dTDP-4-dehydrorhamnose 3,5-epimerase [Helicobacter cholecystus]
MSRFSFTSAPLKGVYIIEPKPIKDSRGYFERYFCTKDFLEIGLNKPIVQINHSYTKGIGSIRGLHYQTPPHTEIKIIRCLKGKIYDVAVDIRENSPTFCQYFGIELSEENGKYLYIPEGFAHGFQTLSDEAEILYLVTSAFNAESDSGLNALDPVLAIKWPLPIGHISEKDKNASYINQEFKGIKC